jgi:hypothetical protein
MFVVEIERKEATNQILVGKQSDSSHKWFAKNSGKW